jgi:uncharacterized protein YqjF (DUF2071 family)
VDDAPLARQLALREMPGGQHVMHQTWRELLFLHWRFPPEAIQGTLPTGLTVDTYDGLAFVGLVPFFMRNVRPRFLPVVPGISNFLETNVRTYVIGPDGTPGVWFYSLDAGNRLAVQLARRLFHLPYFHAEMKAERVGETIRYQTRRAQAASSHMSRFEYAPVAPAQLAEPGSLDFFLVERYVLFASRGDRLAKGRVHHVPYPVQPAEASQWDAGLLALAGLPAPEHEPDHVAFSSGVDVRVYPLEWLRSGGIARSP